MKQYKVVLFDLDHTLWDYDRNSYETLTELYHQHELAKLNKFSFQQFHSAFQQVNARLWDLYDRGKIDRHVIRNDRFKMILESVNAQHDAMANQLSADYLSLSPTKKHLVDGAIEALNHLKGRYPLYIVTNGFTEIQSTKVKSGSIEQYFQTIVTSEQAGHKKPAKEIFEFTLNHGGFNPSDAIMIGDNLLTDIAGAVNAGIDNVHFNPNSPNAPAEGGMPTPEFESKITHRISKLIELKSIL